MDPGQRETQGKIVRRHGLVAVGSRLGGAVTVMDVRVLMGGKDLLGRGQPTTEERAVSLPVVVVEVLVSLSLCSVLALKMFPANPVKHSYA